MSQTTAWMDAITAAEKVGRKHDMPGESLTVYVARNKPQGGDLVPVVARYACALFDRLLAHADLCAEAAAVLLMRDELGAAELALDAADELLTAAVSLR